MIANRDRGKRRSLRTKLDISFNVHPVVTRTVKSQDLKSGVIFHALLGLQDFFQIIIPFLQHENSPQSLDTLRFKLLFTKT